MTFKLLRISNWRQFRQIDIDFHERLTIITGANGAGKTTLLNILSRHFGWQGTLVSTPKRLKTGRIFSSDIWTDEYLLDYGKWLDERLPRSDEPPPPPLQGSTGHEIGQLTYGNGDVAQLVVPPSVGASFQIAIQQQRPQLGMHIPSHRPIYSYQSVENIPTVPRRRDQAYSAYLDIVRNRYYGGHTQRTPNYYMKETLIALAAFGYGNAAIEKDHESLAIFEGFEKILSTILPTSIGFKRLAIRLPEVVLVTRTGDFSLDAISGGIASLVDLAWQIFMYAPESESFAVTIDEPENHLHPELQRTVLATLLAAFPQTQFICATHNPFIVTSVADSNIYALRYGADHKVVSEALSTVDRSGTSNEVLRDVLGLQSSSPTWVEQELQIIVQAFLDRDPTPALLDELRERLRAAGLERYLPKSLARVAQERSQDD